jgi:hypothetical protein
MLISLIGAGPVLRSRRPKAIVGSRGSGVAGGVGDHLAQVVDARVRAELTSRYDDMVRVSTKAYVDRMIEGLGHWIDAGGRGHLAWGILHFRRS